MAMFNKFFSDGGNSSEDAPSIFRPVYDQNLAQSYLDFCNKAQEQFAKALEFQQIAFEKFFDRFDRKDDETENDEPLTPPADKPESGDDVPELPGATPDADGDDTVKDKEDETVSALDKLGEKIDNAKVFWDNFGAAGTVMVIKADPWSDFMLDRYDSMFGTPTQVEGEDTMDAADDVWVMYSRDDDGNLLMSWGRSKKELQGALDAYTDNKEKMLWFEPLLSVDDSLKDGYNAETDKHSKSDGALAVGFLPF
jgi:hypothetical protein